MTLLVSVNAATLLAILIYGYKVVRFLNKIEFKTDMMWRDYEHRMRVKTNADRS